MNHRKIQPAALLVAAVLAAGIGLGAQSGPPPLMKIILTPGPVNADGLIGHVDVTVDLPSMDAPAGAPLLRMPVVYVNIQTAAATMTGFTAADASGPVPLETSDEPAEGPTHYRTWIPNRTVKGDLSIRYRAPIDPRPQTRSEVPIVLRSEDGGFHGGGAVFIIAPAAPERYGLKVQWNLSALGPDARGVSSLGDGDAELAEAGAARRLTSLFFMAGPVSRYPENPPAGGFSAAWLTQPPFDPRPLMNWAEKIYVYYRRFFKTEGDKPYRVFLRTNRVNAGGGMGLFQSFVATFDDRTRPESLKLLLAHEMFHTFAPTIGEGATSGRDSTQWFDEGLAVHYQRILPVRAGLIEADAFIKSLNSTARRYYTNLLNGTPNDQIAPRFWEDTRIRVLPYDRGSLYMAVVDGRIRKASGGKRGLDDVVLAMVERENKGLANSPAVWVELTAAEYGPEAEKEYEAMLAGAVQVPDEDAFGPQYRRIRASFRRFDLGFESKVMIEKPSVIRGLVPGSEAEKAGLRNGDEILMAGRGLDSVQGNPEATLTLKIRRGDKEMSVTYLPRGETVDAWQWVPADTRDGGPQTEDSRWAGGLAWRNIGPYRGGRATTAVGVPGHPQLYYMGATGGGVWKSEDGGRSWGNISDGFFSTGSIGDIAVFSANPRILYVGTGEAPVRGQMSSYGDGVYRSNDAGRTWRRAGLEKTRQISRVVIHPGNPDLVYVAAQGGRWGATEDRGIYRSRDGGASWQRVLFSSVTAGASDLAMDPRNPNVLYAAFWDLQRFPWAIRSGGPGAGIWKTIDGGERWVRLRTGLPEIMGKIRLAVSPADPGRLYAAVEAERGGLYRSDDAGGTWRLMSDNGAITTRPWYYLGVTADPRDADTVYVSQAVLLKSVDGGACFTAISTPHIDTHSLWINPDDPSNLVNTDDGGASVSFDGGRTWSPIDNQPTAQFYAAQTDDLFPYNVYGGQQDFGPVSVSSRPAGGLRGGSGGFLDFGAGESGRFGFDPKNPRFLFISNFLGALTLVDRETGLMRNAGIWPGQHLGLAADRMPYRFCWSSPVAVSPFDPETVYHGANVLLRTEDQGVSWTVISPDLTRNDASRHGRSGPFWHDGSGGEVYNAIFSIVESSRERGTIWVGTDDGLVQLTRDGGRSWTNVTPAEWGEGWILSVKASPHSPAKAYAVFSRHRRNDYTPHIFRTTDYGRTWTDLAGGLPPGHPARAVCEDPEREGLLFAAAEYGVWVSLDDGGHWRSLQRNLPRVPVSDLTVHDGDLIAATEGRGFWIMDDITPLRESGTAAAEAPLFLYSPRRAVRIAGIGGYGAAEREGASGRRPANPPYGAAIHYSLARLLGASDRLTLEILDEAGAVVRSFAASAEGAGKSDPPETRSSGLTASAGLNRFAWDLRGEPVAGVPGNGPLLPSGRYLVRMTLGAASVCRPLEVVPDPRTPSSAETERGRTALVRKLMELNTAFNRALGDLAEVRAQAGELMKRAQAAPSPKRDAAIRALIDNLNAVHRRFSPFNLDQPIGPGDQRPLHYGLGLVGEFPFLRMTIESGWGPATQGERSGVAEIEAEWDRLRALWENALDGIDKVNALVSRSGLGSGIVRPGKK